jgi:hypothetical protein
MHARSISSSRHAFCVRLLRRTARNDSTKYGGLVRGWNFAVRYRNPKTVRAVMPIGLLQGLVVCAFAVALALVIAS